MTVKPDRRARGKGKNASGLGSLRCPPCPPPVLIPHTVVLKPRAWGSLASTLWFPLLPTPSSPSFSCFLFFCHLSFDDQTTRTMRCHLVWLHPGLARMGKREHRQQAGVGVLIKRLSVCTHGHPASPRDAGRTILPVHRGTGMASARKQ